MPVAWIALNLVKGLGPVRIKNLIETYGTPDAVFEVPPSRLVQQGMLSSAIASQLHDSTLFKKAEKQCREAEKLGVSIVALTDSRYPAYLKEIFAPPPVLFIKGNLKVFEQHGIGVIGTRNPTVYGKQTTRKIVGSLVNRNLVIISGLARGIDTVAHEICLEAGGYTVAVLGCGIDIIYPKTNKALAEKICTKGALVSEFPFGTAPETFNFPRRNRIISGLSAGVVVIEAGPKSGSLITANYAVQQGRDVFAVPGPIYSPQSLGTFNLIKDGAIPARDGNEIAESLSVISNTHSMKCNTASFVTAQVDLLNEMERSIFESLSMVPCRIDEIAEKTGRKIADLFDALLNLELRGVIRQVSGQMYIRA